MLFLKTFTDVKFTLDDSTFETVIRAYSVYEKLV